MTSARSTTQALPEIVPRRDVTPRRPTRTQPIPALQICNQPTLSIIVPIHSDKSKVYSFLLSVERAATEFKPEVVFVDSGDDDTAEYLEKIRARFPFEIRRVAGDFDKRPTELATAAVQGFMSAKLEWMCVASVDLTSFPRTFTSLLSEAATDSSDLVLGSRRYHKRWARAFLLRLVSFGAGLFLPKYLRGLSDPLTNLFIVRRSSLFLKRMAPQGARVLPEILRRFPYLEVHEVPLHVVSKESDSFNPSLRDDLRSVLFLARPQGKRK